MIWLQDVALLAPLLFGHVALWLALFNRVHALPLPHRVISALEKVHLAIMAGGPLACVGWALGGSAGPGDVSRLLTAYPTLAVYAVTCGAVGAWIAAVWLWRQAWHTHPPQLASNHTARFDVAAELPGQELTGHWTAALLARVPANQMLELHVHEKTLLQPRLPASLDGLTIGHVSDLHFTGKITRPYFDYLVDCLNERDVDLVVVTGDIVDKPHCIDWIGGTLGRLESRHGTFFVLGNHDKRVPDVAALRRALDDAGLIDLSRRWQRIELRGQPVLLAGNELPWFGPPAEPAAADLESAALRILASHSPDQLAWARRRGFDLMLAGHTHGGQIRLPLVGPVVAPSLHGVKYAAGVFYEPPTLMHVSRGISGLDPIRIHCPPELAVLTLRCP